VLLRLGRERVKNTLGDFSFLKARFGILYNVLSVPEVPSEDFGRIAEGTEQDTLCYMKLSSF